MAPASASAPSSTDMVELKVVWADRSAAVMVRATAAAASVRLRKVRGFTSIGDGWMNFGSGAMGAVARGFANITNEMLKLFKMRL